MSISENKTVLFFLLIHFENSTYVIYSMKHFFVHRTVSGPKVIADLERAHASNLTSEDDLFRPLEAGSSRRQRGQVLASKRHVRKEKTAVQDADDQFFEL